MNIISEPIQTHYTNMYIMRKNHPTQTGIIAAIRDNWVLVWWDEDVSADGTAPPNPIPINDIIVI